MPCLLTFLCRWMGNALTSGQPSVPGVLRHSPVLRIWLLGPRSCHVQVEGFSLWALMSR